MLREEAEREAARRNGEDPDRARFEFYAFDESAGMSPEAWEVAARLRRQPLEEAAATSFGAAATAAGADAHEAPAPEAYAAYEQYAGPQLDPPLVADPHPEVEPAADAFPSQPLEPRPRRRRRRRAQAAEPPEDRPGLFVRAVGLAVIVVGAVWIALVVALAAILTPEDLLAVAVYVGLALLGAAAILLGVAIRRS